MKRVIVFLLCLMLVIPLPLTWAEAENYKPRIGILDSGILGNHEELSDVEIELGENFVFPGSTTDLLGHGTRVAGLIVKECPDVILIPMVVASKYPSGLQKACNAKEIANAIIKAIDEYDCKILNLSLGLKEDIEELRKAIYYAEEMGVVVVAAAGNSGETDPKAKFYPAAYDTVIAVAALDNEGELASFSQKGYSLISAPGVDVPVLSFGFSINPPKASGTSYAAATATGWIAELLEQNPSWTPAELREALQKK